MKKMKKYPFKGIPSKIELEAMETIRKGWPEFDKMAQDLVDDPKTAECPQVLDKLKWYLNVRASSIPLDRQFEAMEETFEVIQTAYLSGAWGFRKVN